MPAPTPTPPPPTPAPARPQRVVSTPPSPAYATAFDAAARSAREPAWLSERRRAAFERFVALGFPTQRHEDWRYTSAAPVARTTWGPAPRRDAPTLPPGLFDLAHAAGARLVFLNGRFLSGPAGDEGGAPPSSGLRISRLCAGLAPDDARPFLHGAVPFDDRAFVAWNAAFFEDGLFLRVGRSACVAAPVEIVHVVTAEAAGAVVHPRLLVVVEEGGHLVLVERFVALDRFAPAHGRAEDAPASARRPHVTNAVAEVFVGPHGAVDHVRVEEEDEDAIHVATVGARLDRDARYSSHSVSFGAGLARIDVDATLLAPGAEVEMNGLYVAGGSRHVDHHTRIDHAAPQGTSRELYRGVLGGASTGVFNGRVIVREGASKTDAQQANHNLLLSDDATADAKPQLEIRTDDVKCAHGATVGRLDDAALFYLRSRGIGVREATDMLVRAFASDVVDRLPGEALKARVDRSLEGRLAAVSAALSPAAPGADGRGS